MSNTEINQVLANSLSPGKNLHTQIMGEENGTLPLPLPFPQCLPIITSCRPPTGLHAHALRGRAENSS